MTTKPAKDIRAGDFLLLDDGRPVRVIDTGRGMWRGSVLIDFAQPANGAPVSPTWTCVDRDTDVTLAT